ncbi:MAG: hypothetical protein PHD87_05560 [Candidatus Cloacimonetes bacterium]|nr:hypothetical protein [Candidatus Cloacimonadota bacterium]
MISAFRRLCYLGLACLLLGACATRKAVASPQAGQPNFRSVYYYLVGSYLQSGGEFSNADELLRRAAKEDPRSQVIQKSILLNSFELWQSELLSTSSLRQQLSAFKEKFGLDEDLLYAASDFYEQDGDPVSARQAIAELRERWPGPRPDLRLFVHELRSSAEPRLELLDEAQSKAQNDPATLRMLAGIWFYYDPLKEKEALLRSHELSPDDESYAYLADHIVRNGDLDLARKYLAELSYPQDRDRMLYLTESSWVSERNPVLVELAETLLATGDVDLLNSLGYAALLEQRPDILSRISSSVDTLSAPAADKQDLYAMLIAHSILIRDGQPLADWIGKLSESGYFDALLSYYVSGANSEPIESWELKDPAAWPAFSAEVRRRFPDEPPARYLTALAAAIQDTSQTAVIDRKLELILHLRQRHTLSEDDYSFLLSYYQQNSRDSLYLQTLREAQRAYPDNPGYCNDLGYSLLQRGEDLQEAARLIRHALVFEPDNIYYLDSLAWYHFLVGEFEAALKLMELPQRQEELPAEIAWHIGAIYLALEDHSSARKWLQKCLDTGGDPAAEQEAEKTLKLIP